MTLKKNLDPLLVANLKQLLLDNQEKLKQAQPHILNYYLKYYTVPITERSYSKIIDAKPRLASIIMDKQTFNNFLVIQNSDSHMMEATRNYFDVIQKLLAQDYEFDASMDNVCYLKLTTSLKIHTKIQSILFYNNNGASLYYYFSEHQIYGHIVNLN